MKSIPIREAALDEHKSWNWGTDLNKIYLDCLQTTYIRNGAETLERRFSAPARTWIELFRCISPQDFEEIGLRVRP